MPNIGDIKQGRAIGKKSLSQRFIWAICAGCSKTRWVHYIKKTNKPKSACCIVCGHLGTNRELRVSFSVRRISRLFTSFGVRARRRNLDANLSKVLFAELVNSDCYYCGDSPGNREKDRGRVYVYQGIDRVNNTKGYEIDNVVPCCILCNKMKKAMGQEEFLLHIHKIATRFTAESPQSDFDYTPYESVLVL